MSRNSHSEFIAEPPSRDLGAEISVLGAIELDGAYLADAVKIISDQDFSDRRHAKIFRAMFALRVQEIPIDPITIADELTRQGELESCGGVAYLTRLADGLPQKTNVTFYAAIVRKHAERRKLVATLSTILKRTESLDESNAIISDAITELSALTSTAGVELFHSYEQVTNAPPLRFAIRNFLQCDGATLLAGLSEHFKTFLMLSIVKSLLGPRGRKLWDLFEVEEPASRVVYLIPESGLGPFVHRLKLFDLLPHVQSGRLLIRTLALGPAPKLQDPRILAAAKGADVFLDTLVRFIDGDESSASDNNRGFGADVFALQSAGARTLTAAAHSPKAFRQQDFMALENMVRGSGDIGAAFATAWGTRQLPGDIAHLENIKSRDFEPCGPFQLSARPSIDEEGNFRLHKSPGDCGTLSEEMPTTKNNSGASPESRDVKAEKIALLRKLYAENPNRTWADDIADFKKAGFEIARGTIRKYKSEAAL